jgi:hypothetical protein
VDEPRRATKKNPKTPDPHPYDTNESRNGGEQRFARSRLE